jgi:hypothetical protein
MFADARAQMSCTQLDVKSSGADSPPADSLVAASALYDANDPGVLINIYDNPTSCAS